ncbi:leukocyte receptor cluster member 1 homolog [Drosophila santomea]|uniref:leukocyte receptor cluster member 1 homolog n=1 Tax=Drosophila santomea TaxID=129105 RepID=UPI0019530000|nr:leukocyte receptor cluster member 1 homolog [Drosophila santomea]
MNILPKKRWHVRTKENIARVRRDQAAAAAEEKVRQEKLDFAESEARINFLRRQSGLPEKVSKESQVEPQSSTGANKGVDLFADYKARVKTTNKDLEKEKKEEQEKYEKQIGYLTYLGQDTNEALKVRSWYEVAPKRPEVGDPTATEAHLKQKLAHDPLTLINALLPPEKKDAKKATKRKRERTPTPPQEPSKPHKIKKSKKDKKHKKHKSKTDSKESLLAEERHKREKIERLRRERLQRERAERQRSEALLAPKERPVAASAASTPAPTPRIVQKYNSQFNPDLAKQNM